MTRVKNKKRIIHNDDKTKKGLLKHLVARQVDNNLLITLVINGNNLPDSEKLMSLLQNNFENFGLNLNINKLANNVILTEGLVLQEKKSWELLIERETSCGGNGSELYFVETDLEAFQEKLDQSSYEIEYVHRLKTYEWGQRAIRFYDPDGHMIEIGEMK